MNAIYQNYLPEVLKIAKTAGLAILDYYQHPEKVEITVKADSSPVTQADILAHKIISEALQKLTPDIPILSEEAAQLPFTIRRTWQRYWLVDPLDGTKEFIHRTDDFTVNIALIENGHSICGVIYAPVIDKMYYAVKDQGAYQQQGIEKAVKIRTRVKPENDCIIALSRRHSVENAKKLLYYLPQHQLLTRGSSLKTCLIAEGLADVYPSFGPTSEWDMGAAQCIIEEAGGAMVDLAMQPLVFNQKVSFVNPPLLIIGDTGYDWGSIIKKIRLEKSKHH